MLAGCALACTGRSSDPPAGGESKGESEGEGESEGDGEGEGEGDGEGDGEGEGEAEAEGEGETVDAGPIEPDAPTCIGAGELCETGSGCCPGLECWFLACVTHFACTHFCSDVSECGDVEHDVCCKRPGAQESRTVCYPDIFEENPAVCEPECGCSPLEGCAE
jgi:hypothetical protein